MAGGFLDNFIESIEKSMSQPPLEALSESYKINSIQSADWSSTHSMFSSNLYGVCEHALFAQNGVRENN